MEENKRSRKAKQAFLLLPSLYNNHNNLNWELSVKYSSWSISLLNIYSLIIHQFTLKSSQLFVFRPKTPEEPLHVRIRVFRESTLSHGPVFAASWGAFDRSPEGVNCLGSRASEPYPLDSTLAYEYLIQQLVYSTMLIQSALFPFCEAVWEGSTIDSR